NFEFFSQDPPTADGNVTMPLAQRLFTRRLALLVALDAHDVPGGPVRNAERIQRRETADLLHGLVAGMNEDSFGVRPHWQIVHRYLDRSAWDDLDAQRAAEIDERLSGLPSAERDDDEDAKRFDLLILQAQLCILDHQPGFAGVAAQVQEITGALLEQATIPAIRDQQVFLEAVADPQWWVDVTVPMLEEARRRVRSLVRLIERTRRNVVYTDFTDELGELAELPALPGSGQASGERFNAKVREFLRQHENHIAIHRLRSNHPLTAIDLTELERMLVETGEFDRDKLDRAVTEAGGLGLYVRSLIGLDRDAVNATLSARLR